MSTRVYVGNIPYDTRERDLENFFKGFGRIRDISLKNGYAFVDFDDYRDAEDAVYEMDGKKLLGRRVSVEEARGKPRGRDREIYGSSSAPPRGRGPPVRTSYRIFVENLSSSVSWQDLKDHLSAAGEVTFADAHKKYKNEGIAEFASYEDMKRAIKKFDDTVLNGRRIRLVEDKSTRRTHSRSRSRGRSKSRSKSPRSKSRSRSARRESKSRSRSKSKGRRSKSKSVHSDHSKNGEDKRSPSRSRSRSHKSEERRSPSRKRSRSNSAESSPEKKAKRSSRSKSASRSRSRSRSHSE